MALKSVALAGYKLVRCIIRPRSSVRLQNSLHSFRLVLQNVLAARRVRYPQILQQEAAPCQHLFRFPIAAQARVVILGMMDFLQANYGFPLSAEKKLGGNRER